MRMTKPERILFSICIVATLAGCLNALRKPMPPMPPLPLLPPTPEPQPAIRRPMALMSVASAAAEDYLPTIQVYQMADLAWDLPSLPDGQGYAVEQSTDLTNWTELVRYETNVFSRTELRLTNTHLFWRAVTWTNETTNQVTLVWDPNPETNLTHYTLYWWTLMGTNLVSVPTNQITITVSNLPAVNHSFVLTASNPDGESQPSNLVTWTP